MHACTIKQGEKRSGRIAADRNSMATRQMPRSLPKAIKKRGVFVTPPLGVKLRIPLVFLRSSFLFPSSESLQNQLNYLLKVDRGHCHRLWGGGMGQ